MSFRIVDPELFGVTESTATLHCDVRDDAGPVDAEVEILLDGEVRGRCAGDGTRRVRLEGLDPATSYRLEIRAGSQSAEPDEYLPERFQTLPAPTGEVTASVATLNDLHFGEERFGGTLTDDHEYGDAKEGFPMIQAGDTEIPYWSFMNGDAIAEINAANVDATIIKGDIADRGRRGQFEAAADAFAKLRSPHHAFLGNHDYYGRHFGEDVDGFALLGQEPTPRSVELGGWRLVLLETAEPGEHHGVFGEERLAWLSDALEESRESMQPTLLFMHHHPVPPEHADSYPNTIGLRPEHSLLLFDLLGAHPQVKGVLIGHTHRNRIRHYPGSGAVPWVEVNCTKDYPGGWGHYRLFDDGSFRQEVRRTSTPRALLHSSRAAHCFRGFYRNFALGRLAERSFSVAGD